MERLKKEDIKRLFRLLEDTMTAHRDELISLDGVMGDGDLGITMTAGFRAANETVGSFVEEDLGVLFQKAGMAMAKAAPSTMGTLLASGFISGGKALKDHDELTLTDISRFFSSFVAVIMDRGKSKPGEKTILDALFPASSILGERALTGDSILKALTAAHESARAGLESTKAMVAQHGRAAYYQEKSLGKQDPGATVGMLIVKCFADMAGSFP